MTEPGRLTKGGSPLKPKVLYTLTLVSPKQARELADEAFPQQRKVRPHHVEFLRQLLVHGHFREGTEIHFARVAEKGGERYNINGQHTLQALGQCSAPYWLTLVEHAVTTYEEVGRLYTTFDRPLMRSWSDVFQAHGALVDAALGPSQVKILSTGMSLLANGMHREAFGKQITSALLRDPELRLGLMLDWQEEALRFFAALRGEQVTVKLLKRAAVAAVGLITCRFQPAKATQFWGMAAKDSGLTDGQPAKSLLRFLRDTPGRKFDSWTYGRTVAACWNAFFDGRELFTVRSRPVQQPFFLAGTPHDGKAVYRYLAPTGKILHEPEAMAQAPEEEA